MMNLFVEHTNHGFLNFSLLGYLFIDSYYLFLLRNRIVRKMDSLRTDESMPSSPNHENECPNDNTKVLSAVPIHM